jgi:hypothetical protein
VQPKILTIDRQLQVLIKCKGTKFKNINIKVWLVFLAINFIAFDIKGVKQTLGSSTLKNARNECFSGKLTIEAVITWDVIVG